MSDIFNYIDTLSSITTPKGPISQVPTTYSDPSLNIFNPFGLPPTVTNAEYKLARSIGGDQNMVTFYLNITANPQNRAPYPSSRFPYDYEDFAKAFKAQVSQNWGVTAQGDVIAGFYLDFKDALRIDDDPAWTQILGNLTAEQKDALVRKQFSLFFNDFLTNLRYPNGAMSAVSFWSQWSNALTKIAPLSISIAQQIGGSTMPSFQMAFQTFFPNGDFNSRLRKFYNEQVAKNGYFVPSVAYQQWANELAAEAAFATSLTPSNFKATLTLDRIFLLASEMLNTLQRVAAAQAKRLLLFTQWQQAYTEELKQIRVFTVNDGTRLGGTDDTTATERGKANTEINRRYQDLVQNYRSLASSDAQAMQSSVNQSNDAVTQQANMATAIIQELSTILSALFRG